MIGKAMIEIPPKFKNMPRPIGIKGRSYRNAEGLAEDVKYYGEWMREKALKCIGQLYPQADLPKDLGGGKATVIAWIWSRTVPESGPSLRRCCGANCLEFPAELQSRKKCLDQTRSRPDCKNNQLSNRAWRPKANHAVAKEGTKAGQGPPPLASCLIRQYARVCEADWARWAMGVALLAIVAEGKRGRVYLPINT